MRWRPRTSMLTCALAAVVWGCSVPTVTEDETHRSQLAGSPPATPAPSDAGQSRLDSAWFALDQTFPDQDSLSGFELIVGTFERGVTGHLSVAFEPLTPSAAIVGALPFAVGRGGDVLYGYFDGRSSHLGLVSAGDGASRMIVDRDGVIFHTAVVDADQRSAFVLTLDPATRGLRGIERVDLASGEMTTVADLTADAARRSQTVLRLFQSRERNIVLLDCPTDRVCRATVFDPARGERLLEIPTIGGSPVGVLGDVLLVNGGCEQPCGLAAYSLTTGGAARLGTACGPAVMGSWLGGPVVIASQPSRAGVCDLRPTTIAAFDERSGAVGSPIKLPDTSRELVTFEDTTAGASVPAGWVLVSPDGGVLNRRERAVAGPALVNLSDGRIIARAPLNADDVAPSAVQPTPIPSTR